MSLLCYIVLLSAVRYFGNKNNSVNSYTNKDRGHGISVLSFRTSVDNGVYPMKTKKPFKFFFSGLRVKAVNEERFIIGDNRFPKEGLNTIEETSTDKQTQSESTGFYTYHDFENVILQTPPHSYTYSTPKEIYQHLSQELILESSSQTSFSHALSINDDEDYESSTELSGSGFPVDYVSEANHEQTVTPLYLKNSEDRKKISEDTTDQSPESITDESTVSFPKQYLEEQKETVVELFDETGRIGPDFKVHDQIIFESQPSPPVQHVDHASIDTNLLEKDIMIVDIKDFNVSEVREILTDISKLEKSVGDRHRDYGSSYILPVLSRVNYDNNTVPLTFSDELIQTYGSYCLFSSI